MLLRPRPTARHRGILGGTAASIGLALVLALALDGPAVSAPAAAGTDAKAAVPESVSAPVNRAKTALDHAITNIRQHHPVKARAALQILRNQIIKADQAGRAQIGAPPTDPESDDLPGPPSVLAVLRVEHRMTMDLSVLFDGLKAPLLTTDLRHLLRVSHLSRDGMLDEVIALPPEGDGADYADGMADTVGTYKQEVQTLNQALATDELTAAGKLGLTHALSRVQATKAKVDAAFGGGE